MKRAALAVMGCGCLLLPVITLILVLKFVSDRRPQPVRSRPSGITLSIPPAGNARLLPRQISQSDKRLEWQWTIVGDRNWTAAKLSETGFRLAGAYPFNSRVGTQNLGGTHIWIVGLVVSRASNANPRPVRVDSSIHGSNGMTLTRSWDVGISGPLSTAVSVSQKEDGLTGIPSDLTLAAVAGKPLTLSINP